MIQRIRPRRALMIAAGIAAFAATPAPAAEPFLGPVAPASCGAGSLPETGLQGQVPKADRLSGRSAKGYRCNLELVGRWQGQGASWVNPSYDHCAYVAQHFPAGESNPGVQVLDVSDPAHPRRTAVLRSPAMLGPWESLKVHAGRKLLAAVNALGPAGQGAAFLDVYDISDCAHPRLLNAVGDTDLTLPANTLGHEGGFSPDGRTYWSASAYLGLLTAIDVTDPGHPRVLWTGRTGVGNHGFGFSPDGTRLYLAEGGRLGSGALLTSLPEDLIDPNGMQIFDVREIQNRVADPRPHLLGELTWTDGAAGQHAIPITYAGRPYVVFVDELGLGGPRIIDVSDPGRPVLVAALKLAVQMPAARASATGDTSNPILFTYDSHYCTVDRPDDPTALACGEFASGVRVFDIRGVGEGRRPREIAYFNPPAQTGRSLLDLPGSEHAATLGDMTTDWCSSPPRFVGDQLWVTCQDNGFMTLRFTNGVWPVQDATPAACRSRRAFVVHLPRGMRSAAATLDGRRVPVRGRPGRLQVRVSLRGRGRTMVRLHATGRDRHGRRLTLRRTYHPCTRVPPRTGTGGPA